MAGQHATVQHAMIACQDSINAGNLVELADLIKNTRHYATSTWSKRKRDPHGQPMPDHRKRKKLRQLI
jgi:hypothetical protein